MIRGRATLDYGRRVLTIMVGDSREGDWSLIDQNGVLGGRAAAIKAMTADGWNPAPDAEWEISPADNGRAIDVVKRP